jgi:hypothetical protein
MYCFYDLEENKDFKKCFEIDFYKLNCGIYLRSEIHTFTEHISCGRPALACKAKPKLLRPLLCSHYRTLSENSLSFCSDIP